MRTVTNNQRVQLPVNKKPGGVWQSQGTYMGVPWEVVVRRHPRNAEGSLGHFRVPQRNGEVKTGTVYARSRRAALFQAFTQATDVCRVVAHARAQPEQQTCNQDNATTASFWLRFWKKLGRGRDRLRKLARAPFAFFGTLWTALTRIVLNVKR